MKLNFPDVLLNWPRDQKESEIRCYFLSSLAENINLFFIVAQHMIMKDLCTLVTITMNRL